MDAIARLKIGEVAKQSGVSVATLRYYESLKLLAPADRGENGYRYYDQDTVQQVKFIRQAQSLGFSLDEIRQVMNVRDRGEAPCDLVQNLLQQKIEQLATQAQQILSFKAELETYRDRWSKITGRSLDSPICPLIETVEITNDHSRGDRPIQPLVATGVIDSHRSSP